MKSSTYTKNGKGQSIEINSKIGENAMKSSTYKKVDGKVVEIINDNNSLEPISPETSLLNKYQDLFNQIDKGSNVVNFIKTSEFHESLLDALQVVIAELLESKEYMTHDNPGRLLHKAFINRSKSFLRNEITLDLFKHDNLDHVIDSKEYGITKEYISTCLLEIKNILNSQEYKIFKLYHVMDYTTREIAEKLNTNQTNISRRVKIIGDRIASLKISYLYENRYVNYSTGKKKRQYKRKQLTQKEVIDKSGKVYPFPIEDYEPMSFEPIPIPANKALQYPTKQYYKVRSNDTTYTTLRSGKSGVDYITNGVYPLSDTLPDRSAKRLSTYRIKKMKRSYIARYNEDKYNKLGKDID